MDIDAEAIDFRNVELLKRFVTENGRILPRRITGLPAKLHRRLSKEIKKARNVLLMK
ncbi:30S ribosomal protein S18 [Methylacidiphilum caldifontis]|nr:30S ribosomal protein S18 [Methylacidiphilum caldifontis]